MSTAPLAAELLTALVRRAWKKGSKALAVGVHSQAPYGGPERLRVGTDAGPVEFDVLACGSTLAVRAALAEPRERPFVFVTDRSEEDLGADVSARIARRRLLRARPWELVLDLFHAQEADRSLLAHAWLADALIRAVPPQGYAPVPAGILDADTAWGAFLREVLGLADARPDLRTLARWASRNGQSARLASLPGEVLHEVRARLVETAGDGAAALVHVVAAGRAEDVVPLGLVAGVVFAEGAPADGALRSALVRLEPLLGGHTLGEAAGRIWAEAAEALTAEAASAGDVALLGTWHRRAEVLLDELRIRAFAHRSAVLPLGFAQRMEALALALRDGVAARGPQAPADAEQAFEHLLGHREAAREELRVVRARMALRLARWLTTEPMGDAGASLGSLARAYEREGAFVDRARYLLAAGDAEATLSAAYAELVERATRRREVENRRFGEALAGWLQAGGSGGGLLPIEEVLGRVLAPLAEGTPVLLLVMDGMSHAVYRELAQSLTELGWVHRQPAEGALPPVVAALPSVTNVSRTSLLCGRLATGPASTEKAGFVAHPGLVAASRTAKPPVLFHKAEVKQSGAVGVPADLLQALQDPTQQVVGLVVNAVDDYLAKGEQVEPRWTVDTVVPLRQILERARYAGRALVLTSDHGHVPERGTVLDRHGTESARARPADGLPKEGEVLLEGPRVLGPMGQRLIAPWSERIRYGPKQNGYHGGASPQEVLVPLAVMAPADRAIAGWQEVSLSVPVWWEGAAPPAPPVVSVKPVPKPEPPTGLLFETGETRPVAMPEPPAVPVEEGRAWVGRLLSSPVYAEQRKLAGRMAPKDELVREVLLALATRGGKLTRPALARQLDLPELRLPGMLRAVQRLLNVDGYAVLQTEEESGSVEVNLALLEAQFGI